MLSNILSALYFLVFLLCGHYLSRLLFSDRKPLVIIWMGGVFGVVMTMWFPAVFAFLIGFSLAAQLLALIPALLIGCCCFIKINKAKAKLRFGTEDLKAAAVLTPFFILGFALFITHTIIPAADGSLHVGQSTFGDLSMHLGIVTSISVQGAFPPGYSIFPGTPLGYPFLCDSISATFYTLGSSLRFAMLLPSVTAFALVLLGVWCFFSDWLEKRNYTVIAFLIFFIGGGFGFAYFFDLIKENPLNFSRIFSEFYQTPTNLPDLGLRWVNPIADMLIPQRATLFGWTVLFPCLFLLRRAAFEDEKPNRNFLILGVLAGCMPLIHTHSFLALGIISAVFLAGSLFRWETDRLKGWAIYAAAAAVIAAPQLIAFTFRQAESFLKYNFNWANETDSYLWFYIKNLGLIAILLPAAWMMADKKDRRVYAGALAILVIAEFIQFQPNPYDNNKLLFVWFAFTCGLVAKALCVIYEKLKGLKGIRFISFAALLCVFLSGLLTLGREAVSDYELFGSEQVEAAAFIGEHTAPDAVILTAPNHNNAAAALSGRNIVCGADTFLYFHGLNTKKRHEDVKNMFAYPEKYADLFNKYSVDYVYIGDYERYEFDIDEDYFQQHYEKIFENEEVTLYSIGR